MSTIEACEEGDTQLYIANSLEVRSDEICAESVLVADNVAQGSIAARVDAVDKNGSLHTVVCNEKHSSTVANSICVCRHSGSRRHSGNQKSHNASSSDNAAVGFHCKLQSASCHSDTGTHAGSKHTCSVLHPDSVDNNSTGCRLKEDDVLKSCSQV